MFSNVFSVVDSSDDIDRHKVARRSVESKYSDSSIVQEEKLSSPGADEDSESISARKRRWFNYWYAYYGYAYRWPYFGGWYGKKRATNKRMMLELSPGSGIKRGDMEEEDKPIVKRQFGNNFNNNNANNGFGGGNNFNNNNANNGFGNNFNNNNN